MPEITVDHRPFSEQNHILTDYLEACSVKRPTSSKTVGKSSQIKNQANYNRCHIKLIAYLTAAQCPSDDGGAHRMLSRDHRRQTCSNILVHNLVDLNLSYFVKTSEDWKNLYYVH